MSSSFVLPERNIIPNRGTSPSLPGNSGAANSSQSGGFKKFFSSTRNVVLLLVGIIVLGTVLGVGAGSGWFSGDSARKSDVPDTPPPDSTKGREEYETPHRALGDDRRDREEEGRWPLHREPGIIYGRKREEGPEVFGPQWGVSGRKEPAILYSGLITMINNSLQNPNPDFDLLVEKLNENNVTKSSQLEQVISEYFKKYSLEGYSPEDMSPKIEKLKRFFNTDRTLEKQILKGIRFSTVDLPAESLRNQNVLDSDVQIAVENLSSDYVLTGYQRKQLAEFDFSFRGQNSKSLYFDRMFDLYLTDYSVLSSENLFEDLSQFLEPSEIKEEATRYRAQHPYSTQMEETLISLEKMCRTSKMKVYSKEIKEREEKHMAEASTIIRKVLDGPDKIVYDDVKNELSNKVPQEFISSAASKFQTDFGKRKNYFLSYLKYYFGHKSLSKHILEAIEIYTKGLTPNAVPNDLWDELQSHFEKYEIRDAIDELETSQSNPWFKFLEIKCGRNLLLSFPDVNQAILDYLEKIPRLIDPLALKLVKMGKNQAVLNTAIEEFEKYESPNTETRGFLRDLLNRFRNLVDIKSSCNNMFNSSFKTLKQPVRSEAIASWLRASYISRDFDYHTVEIVIRQLMKESKDFQFRLFLVDVLRLLGKLSDEQFLSEALSAFKDDDSPQELYTYLKSNLKNVQDLKDWAKKLLKSNDEHKDILEALLGEISNESYKFDFIQEFRDKKKTINPNLFVIWFKNFKKNFSTDIYELINYANADKGTTDDKEEVRNLVLLIFYLLSLGQESRIGEFFYCWQIDLIADYLEDAMTFFSNTKNRPSYLKKFGELSDEDCKKIDGSLNQLKEKFFPPTTEPSKIVTPSTEPSKDVPPSTEPLLKVTPPEPSPADTKPAETTVSKNPEVSFPYDCSICLEFLGGPHTSITKCGHIFCKSCIEPVKSKPCPNCRAENPNPLPLKNVRVEKKDVEGKEEIKIYVSCSSESCPTKPENLKKFFTLICDSTKHTNRNVYCEPCADNLLKKECTECEQVPSKIKIFEVEEKKNNEIYAKK